MKSILNYLPYQKHIIHSKLNIDEIRSRIENLVETDPKKRKRNFFTSRANTTKEYEGIILSDGFLINRIIRTRNSYLPDIAGRFESFQNGTIITLILKPDSINLIVSAIIFLGFLAVSIIIVPLGIIEQGFQLPMLIPFFCVLFTYLIITIPFKRECKKSMQTFHLLFEIAAKERFN